MRFEPEDIVLLNNKQYQVKGVIESPGREPRYVLQDAHKKRVCVSAIFLRKEPPPVEVQLPITWDDFYINKENTLRWNPAELNA